MTEAMSRRDIEDVLTSIKRLVSQDAQARPATESAAPPPRPEKLVLTPALRVMPDGDAPADTPVSPTEPKSEPQTADTPAAETPAPASYSLLRRISQAGTAADAPPLQSVPATDPDSPDSFPEDTLGLVMDSLEDSALEETLARLEAVLSGKPVPPADPESPDTPDTAETPSADGEQVIDEGMLYQLVAHIVRQELQGELGEKITRNIRKLVRQEVARELQLRRN